MKRLVVLAYLVATCGALVSGWQAGRPQGPDETNVPDMEKRVPPGDYCKMVGVTIGPKETHAHSCACKYSCYIDAEGNVTDHESSDCLTYCHINGRRCTCHPEGDPSVTCEGSKANAITDMDGHVTAMKLQRHRP